MKSAKVYCEAMRSGKDKAILNFKIDRTSKDKFNMGNSSLLINFNKLIYSNPICTYQNKTYSSGDYEPISTVVLFARVLSLQFRCNGTGKEVSDRLTKLVTVEFDLKGKIEGLSWRAIDTAIVTPQFETINTEYFLNIKQ